MMINEENIGILLNFIYDVIVTSSPWIFKGFLKILVFVVVVS